MLLAMAFAGVGLGWAHAQVRSRDEVPVACGGFPDVPPLPRPAPRGRPIQIAAMEVGPRVDPQIGDLTRLSSRARTDSDYLATVGRIKDYLSKTSFDDLPLIPEFDPRESRIMTPYDNYKYVQQTVIYYRLALKVLSAADDPFQMTRLYADLALVGTPAASAMGSLLLLVQIGTVYEAFRQIVMFRVTGIALGKRALLAQRTLLSVIQRLASHRGRWYSLAGGPRPGAGDDDGAEGRDPLRP